MADQYFWLANHAAAKVSASLANTGIVFSYRNRGGGVSASAEEMAAYQLSASLCRRNL